MFEEDMWRHGSANFEFQNTKFTKAIINKSIQHQKGFCKVKRYKSCFQDIYIYIYESNL